MQPQPPATEKKILSSRSDIWIVAEIDGGRLKEVSLEALCDARELAGSAGVVTAVLFGDPAQETMTQLGRYGADRVLVAGGSVSEARSVEQCAGILSAAIQDEAPRLVLFGATLFGCEVASRLAAAKRLSLANHCNQVRWRGEVEVEATRAVYGGKLQERVRLKSRPALASLTPGAAGVGKPTPRQPPIGALPPLRRVAPRITHLDFVSADPRTVDITEAERIVAVGRGVAQRDRLELYERLAERLQAAMAASRPLVDAGWLPFERQVGQTGRVVAPRLYVAAGISGASHHVLGMKASECVVAINRDKTAEIFKLADLKVAADLDTLMPILVARLEKASA